MIAEDDALIGTPEIRAADARIITEQAAGQPESFEIGQTSAVEAGDPVLQTVSAVGPGAPDPTRDEADEAEQANMEPDASADSAATNADSGEQDDREAEAGDVVADEHRPEQTLEDQVEAGVEEFAEEGVDDAGEQPEVTAELGEGGYEEAEEEEGYEEAEEEEGYEEEEDGEDDDPYGVDKYVEGVDAEAGDEAGADEAEANGEEELEEYGEEEEAGSSLPTPACAST